MRQLIILTFSGGSFRTSRLRASSLLGPNSRFQPSVQPTQQTLVVDVQRPNGGNSQQKEESKNVRRRETIFGPDVGEDDEPGWTKADEGTKVDVNVVKGWVEKAKSEEVSKLFLDHGAELKVFHRAYTRPQLCKHLST